MNSKSLLEREIQNSSDFNPSLYSKEVLKDYYNSSEYFYRSEINVTKGVPGKVIDHLCFSLDGNFMTTAHNNRLVLWSLNNPNSIVKSKILKTNFNTITNISFNNDSSKIIYSCFNLESDFTNLHVIDTATGRNINNISTNSFISAFSANPINPNIVTLANYERKIFSYDLRTSTANEIRLKKFESDTLFNSLKYHPIQDNVILVAVPGKNDVCTFDVRNSEIIMRYELPYHKIKDVFNACYNRNGSQILVTKKNVGPILFNSEINRPLFEFDEFGFYCPTISNYCCFAGIEDEYIAAGSYNFSIYMWKIPCNDTKPNNEIILRKISKSKFNLKGHISSVMGVSYNHPKSILASFGDDKKLMFWSPFSLYYKSRTLKHDISNSTSLEVDKKYFFNSNRSVHEMYRCFLREEINTFSSRNEFYKNLTKVFKMKTKDMEKSFEENLSIQFIYSFLLNYKTSGKLVDSELLEKLGEYSDQKVKHPSLKVSYLSLLYEIKKIFERKNIIINCIDFLIINIRLSERMIKKLTILNKNNLVLESLKKINFIMKLLIYDLIVMFKLNQNLCDTSYQFMKNFLSSVDKEDKLDDFEYKVFKTIFKSEDSIMKFDTKLSLRDHFQSQFDSNEDEPYCFQTNLMFRENQIYYISSDSDISSDSNSSDSTSDIEYVINYNETSDSENNSSKNINKIIDESIENDKKRIKLDNEGLNSLNKEKNFLDEDLSFCLNDNSKLNFYEQYNDEVILRLKNNFSFIQKFKKEFSSLKITRLDSNYFI